MILFGEKIGYLRDPAAVNLAIRLAWHLAGILVLVICVAAGAILVVNQSTSFEPSSAWDTGRRLFNPATWAGRALITAGAGTIIHLGVKRRRKRLAREADQRLSYVLSDDHDAGLP